MNKFPIQTELGVCTLSWEGDRVTGFRLPDGTTPRGDAAPDWVEAIGRRVAAHISGVVQDFEDVPYDWERVTEFQRDVYRVSLGVKSGATWSYGQVAKALGLPPGGARAIGVALGQNP